MERVRKCIWMTAMIGGVAIFADQGSAQNLLVNPGFEDPITSDGPPFVGFWEAFNGGGGASAVGRPLTKISTFGLPSTTCALSDMLLPESARIMAAAAGLPVMMRHSAS